MIKDPVIVEKDEVPGAPERVREKPRYGIFIYVTPSNEYEIEIVNKEACSLNELLGLVEIARRKLSAVWDTKNDPSTGTLLREIDQIKTISINQGKAIKGIYDVLKGIVSALDLGPRDDVSSKQGEDKNAAVTQDQV